MVHISGKSSKSNPMSSSNASKNTSDILHSIIKKDT